VAGQRDEHGLTKQQRDFVDAYLADPQRNAGRAYESVYTARGQIAYEKASRMLASNGKVAAYVAMREEKIRAKAEKNYDVTQERVLSELAGIAYCDPADLYDEAGNLLPIKDIPERTRRAIASIEHTEKGVKIKLWSKTQGADMLAKHLNLYEQHQRAVTGDLADLMRQIGESTGLLPRVEE
jgi:phage terminase small subunit